MRCLQVSLIVFIAVVVGACGGKTAVPPAATSAQPSPDAPSQSSPTSLPAEIPPPPPPPPPEPATLPGDAVIPAPPAAHPPPKINTGNASSNLEFANKNYAVVKTYFATDRNLTGNANPAAKFGGKRASVSYGICKVSIPRDHRMGELEAPSVWRLQFRENPAQHVVLLSAEVETSVAFFADLSARVRASGNSSAFLFVHGYNVTFADAARRTAQIAYDLAFSGAPVFYSWPSQGNTAAYTVDEQNVEWAQANLRHFLEDFLTRSDAQSVFLIAHSMGNRALTRALASLLAEKPALARRLTEVILTAPDIDADVFKRDIAPALTASGRPITLYASSGDLALAASKQVHGYARAGDSGAGLVVIRGIETIDATGMDTSLLGHSYFADSRSVLSDLFNIVRNHQQADQRFGLRRVESPIGRYWTFKH